MINKHLLLFEVENVNALIFLEWVINSPVKYVITIIAISVIFLGGITVALLLTWRV